MEDKKPAYVSVGSADPGDAPSDSSSPVAVSLAEVERQLKQTQREAKHARLKGELRTSKPQGATAYHWTYFQTYVPVSLQMYSICKLCWEQGELDRAEVKYNQSPTNLLRHLNTAYPGHKEAYEACKDHKAGLKKAGGLSAAAGGGGGGGASSIGSTSMGQVQ